MAAILAGRQADRTIEAPERSGAAFYLERPTMSRAHASGNFVIPSDVPKMLAMIARGDRIHDIAAWYGLNQGRMAEVEKGEHGTPPLAAPELLPPAGSPGPRARRLRATLAKVSELLKQRGADGLADALALLAKAMADFDKPE